MPNMKKLFYIISILIFIIFPNKSYAHSGGTNSSGCHNDNIHGGYHCHGLTSEPTNLNLNLYQDPDPYVICYAGTCPTVNVRKSTCLNLICCSQTNTLIPYLQCLNLINQANTLVSTTNKSNNNQSDDTLILLGIAGVIGGVYYYDYQKKRKKTLISQ